MKIHLKKIVLLLLLIWIMPVIPSCRDQHYLISSIRFLGATLEEEGNKKLYNHYDCTHEFTTDIIFILSYNLDFVASINQNLGGNQCYALTLPTVLDNSLIKSTFHISFDKSFLFKGDTILPNSNILKIDDINKEIEYSESSMTFCGMGSDIVIDFSDEFINQSKFFDEEYEVTFSCATTDSLFFEEKTTINYKL